MTKNINIFGAPHSGKSTFSSKLFSEMKQKHYSVEYVLESVKLNAYVNKSQLSKPYYSLFLNSHVSEKWQGISEYLINDSSPLTSAFYSPQTEELAYKIFSLWDNINFVLPPMPIKQKSGRLQTSDEECQLIYLRILKVLNQYKIEYTIIENFDTSCVFSKL